MDVETIKKMAHLARLGLSNEAAEQLSPQLTSIMDMIDQMQQVDTSKVPALAHPFIPAQSLRPDAITEIQAREALQKTTEVNDKGFYWVPQVIDA